MTKTYYYIEALHIPARAPFSHDSVHLCVLDRKVSFNEYVKLIDEDDISVIIEENIDYPRLFKYYKTKEFAQMTLNKLLESRKKPTLDFPKVPNMMTDMIKENFKEKK